MTARITSDLLSRNKYNVSAGRSDVTSIAATLTNATLEGHMANQKFSTRRILWNRDRKTGRILPVHGMAGTPEFRAWRCMINRCEYPKHISYPRYGGRGIKVCEMWRDSFPAFLRSMGQRPTPNHSLGRIDNDKDYFPLNCEWELPAQQQRNRSSVRFFEYMGERLCLVDWARKKGIHPVTLRQRMGRGWSFEEALLTQPDKTRDRRKKA